MSANTTWRVTGEDAGERLDRYLHGTFTEAWGAEAPSRRQIRRWIDEGRVYVERRRCRTASRAVLEGQRIEVADVAPPESRSDSASDQRPTTASEDGFKVRASGVVYEDDHLLALDKPPGVASQGTRTDDLDHVLAAAVRWVAGGRRQRAGELWLHHRLDRGTSGIILLAKSRAANKGLSRAFAERWVEKRYATLVRGRVETEGLDIDVPLVRVRGEGGRPMSAAVFDDSPPPAVEYPTSGRGAVKTAKTLVACSEVLASASLVEARPLTGRMHQIRVHLACAGHPVLGDRLYGAPEDWRLPEGNVPRPLLHAASLALDHPVTGEPLTLTTKPPVDFTDWYERLRTDP